MSMIGSLPDLATNGARSVRTPANSATRTATRSSMTISIYFRGIAYRLAASVLMPAVVAAAGRSRWRRGSAICICSTPARKRSRWHATIARCPQRHVPSRQCQRDSPAVELARLRILAWRVAPRSRHRGRNRGNWTQAETGRPVSDLSLLRHGKPPRLVSGAVARKQYSTPRDLAAAHSSLPSPRARSSPFWPIGRSRDWPWSQKNAASMSARFRSKCTVTRRSM